MFKRKEPGAVTRLEGNPALAAWPVNSIFLGYTATSPAVLLGGGTWARISQSRFLVGQGSDTDFDTLGETGGEKNHTLTAAEMPSHSHSNGSYAAGLAGGHTHSVDFSSATGSSSGNIPRGTTTTFNSTASPVHSDGNHTHDVTGTSGAAGGGDPHNNLPPYLVIYIWRRTA